MSFPVLSPEWDDGPVFYKSLVGPDGRISRPHALYLLRVLGGLPRERRRMALRTLPPVALAALYEEWWWGVHEGQAEPEHDWRVWAIVAGRGFGKTRAGAEWVWSRARGDMGSHMSPSDAGDMDSYVSPSDVRGGTRTSACPDPSQLRIALVGATIDEVVRVMVNGESGLLAIARAHETARWIPTLGLVRFPSGAEAHVFSAERPEKLRGPQHHFAWCDELAKWPRARAAATWDNLMLGLRLGERTRTIVTTTPKSGSLLPRILALPGCVATHGRTEDNPTLPGDFISAMREMYGGTRLARQELDGVLLDDFEGALWTRDLIEQARAHPSPSRGEGRLAEGERGEGSAELGTPSPSHSLRERAPPSPLQGEGNFVRIVVGLDPPASTGGDSCGIVVCGKDEDGVAWVLADLTARGLTPEAWARRVAAAANEWGHLYTGVPALVVAEKNQGGDMIASVLRAVDATLRVRLVAATKSKAASAEPIALRFETGRAKLAGRFPDLEDQLCALTWSGYEGAGSPDRLDAMVWAMTELFEKRPVPRIRRL